MLLGDSGWGSKTLEDAVVEPLESCIAGKEKSSSYGVASCKTDHSGTLFCPRKKGTVRSTEIRSVNLAYCAI